MRGYIEQLVAGGWLARKASRIRCCDSTASGAALLKGAGTCELFREQVPVKGKSRTRGTAAATFGGDPVLFDRLREVRTRIARERGVPPYVIFHDTTLRQMAERRPQTVEDLHDIYGVGVKKAASVGYSRGSGSVGFDALSAPNAAVLKASTGQGPTTDTSVNDPSL